MTRAERVDLHREAIFRGRDYPQHEFLRFILDHYVARGVGELSTDKLPQLVGLKYHSVNDAAPALGTPSQIRAVFVEFQQHLY